MGPYITFIRKLDFNGKNII